MGVARGWSQPRRGLGACSALEVASPVGVQASDVGTQLESHSPPLSNPLRERGGPPRPLLTHVISGGAPKIRPQRPSASRMIPTRHLAPQASQAKPIRLLIPSRRFHLKPGLGAF